MLTGLYFLLEANPAPLGVPPTHRVWFLGQGSCAQQAVPQVTQFQLAWKLIYCQAKLAWELIYCPQLGVSDPKQEKSTNGNELTCSDGEVLADGA